MEVTRRFWIDVGLLVALATLAVLLSRPILLVGAAIVGAWILADQHRFARTVVDVSDRLEVIQSISREQVFVHEETTVTIGGDLGRSVPVDVTIEAGVPVGATADGSPRITIPAGERKATTEVGVRSSMAGSFQFTSPLITVDGDQGRFTEQFETGPTPAVDVEPGPIQNVHIGQQARQIDVYGDHDTSELGSGFDLAELREYVPGDPASRIDWKATARLSTPYIREFETETDRKVALLVDHRSTMGDGRPGETKLAYVRHVALMLVDRARESNDPIGCYAIDEDGMTIRRPPSTDRGQYARVRDAINRIEATKGRNRHVAESTSAEAHRKANWLDDDSRFASYLHPYFADSRSYHERIEHDPLYTAIRTSIRKLQGPVWTVLFTDDTRRTEVQEAVALARRGSSRVLVFLTPTALFGGDVLDNPDAIYERYAEFEKFRRLLNGMERVSAFELAPEDHLRTVLSTDTTLDTQIRS